MKKFRQKMAEKAGFTLVELIVVIAILGILAAVAVPAYSGYVTKAHEAADIVTLDGIKTAAIATKAEDGAVTSIEVTAASGTISDVKVAVSGGSLTSIKTDSDFQLYMGGTTLPDLESNTYAKGATWNGTNWTPNS